MKKTLIKIGVFTFGGLVSIILLFCSIYLYKNYPRAANAFEIKASNPAQKILIATQGSAFKNQFIQDLCNSLEASDTYIMGIDLDDLKIVDPDNWDHIIIINSFIVNLNRKVNRFIVQLDNPDDIMLFVTAGGADWVPKADLQVDALTSASRIEYSKDLVSLIQDWVKRTSHGIWEPNDYLAALRFFSQVNVEKACKQIKTERVKYEEIYPKLEGSINLAGYHFMRLGKADSALEVFKMNTELFPNRSNVYDSYAEALYASGDIKEAIRNYEKALELDLTKESARSMLEKLKK